MRNIKHLYTILFAIIFINSSNAQDENELAKYATGFENINSNSFSFLNSELLGIRVLGYGEDTHGTSEFTLLAEQLMQYLSDTHGFNIMIIETGFGEGVYLNDYIQGERNDLAEILEDHNSTWRYQTIEFLKLMNWLRDYNKTNSDKIYIYGCEMQYVISDVNHIHKYLNDAGSEYRIDGFDKHLWQSFEEYEKTDYFISYSKLKNYFIENQNAFKGKSSEKEYNLTFHHIEVLGQFVTAINQSVEQRKHDFRDIYMGENIQWILDYHGWNSKALYWAHNVHVGDWIGNGIVDVTGHQLRKIYGSAYFNIATDFGTGEFIASPADANQTGNWKHQIYKYDKVLPNTFSYKLNEMGNPHTFLNIREARKDESLKALLNNPIVTMSGAGARARSSETETNEIGKAFDAILYLNHTSKINFIE